MTSNIFLDPSSLSAGCCVKISHLNSKEKELGKGRSIVGKIEEKKQTTKKKEEKKIFFFHHIFLIVVSELTLHYRGNNVEKLLSSTLFL